MAAGRRRLAALRAHLRGCTAAAAAGAAPEQDEGAALVARLEAERAAWRQRICDEARALQREPLFRHEPVLDQEAFRRDARD